MEDPLASLPITLVLIVTLTEPYTERKELVKMEQVFSVLNCLLNSE